MKTNVLLCLIVSFFLVGCVKKADNCQTMMIDYTLIGGLSSPSPTIKITNIPKGTAFFNVKMTDLDKTSFDHGGGTVAYTGGDVIPEGALKGYRGPEPPAGAVHRYQIVVQSLNSDKSLILGEGKLTKRYP